MIRSRIFFYIVVFGMTAFAFAIGALVYVVNNKCIDFSALERYQSTHPSIVLDDEGLVWARFQLDRRDPIQYDQFPQHLINAFIAAEDWKFFSHHGLSFKGIVRSFFVNLYYGRKVQGASTITQQLVRLLFFDTQKTFVRKIKEQLYALLVEQQFSKEQILQAYLNHAYFGCGIYGVEAASQRFWGIHARELSVEQAATLAGIVQLPEGYCPLVYPLCAQKRRNIVLGNMFKLKFITEQDFDKFKMIVVKVKGNENDIQAPHFKESLRLHLEKMVGKAQLYSGGLVIQTTINRKAQAIAEKAFQENCTHMRTTLNKDIDGAVMSMEVKTGAIKAMVGGYDFKTSKFNRALQAKRQMGSVFKTILYAAAMQAGVSFADTEIDEPMELIVGSQLWKPRNWDNTFRGQMTLAYALSRSNNIVAIKTFLKVGADPIVALAKKSHLEGPVHPYPSLALGCVDVTLKEAIGAFNVFANSGYYVEPHYIEWIKDRWGKKIWRFNEEPERIVSSIVCSKVAKVLGIGIEKLRKRGNWLASEAIAKTGTTNDSRTCWFVGATPSLVTAVYIGCDDNRPMGNVYPIQTALPIWKNIHENLPDGQKRFIYDESLAATYVHELTGQAVDDLDENALAIYV